MIEDTVNLWEPSSTPHSSETYIPTLEPSNQPHRDKYVSLLCRMLNIWAEGSGFSIIGQNLISSEIGVGIVVLTRLPRKEEKHVRPEEFSSQRLNDVLKQIWQVLPDRQGSIHHLRNLKIFTGNERYIFKPLARRYWTETYALNDADEIAAAILSASGSRK